MGPLDGTFEIDPENPLAWAVMYVNFGRTPFSSFDPQFPAFLSIDFAILDVDLSQ